MIKNFLKKIAEVSESTAMSQVLLRLDTIENSVKLIAESATHIATELIDQKKMIIDLYTICGLLMQNDPKLSVYLKDYLPPPDKRDMN